MCRTTAEPKQSLAGRAAGGRIAARPEEIRRRLRMLDRECDTEQALKANAATIAFSGLSGGTGFDVRSLTLPAIVTASLLHYVLTGHCPSLPILRRMGFRTPAEIDAERRALKSLLHDRSQPSAAAGRTARRHRRTVPAAAKRRATSAATSTRIAAHRSVPPPARSI